MAGNTFGQLFRVTTAGESHGPGYVAILDGVPPGLELSERDIQPDLDRRRPGQSAIVSQRQETDTIEILSGVFEGRTTETMRRLKTSIVLVMLTTHSMRNSVCEITEAVVDQVLEKHQFA